MPYEAGLQQCQSDVNGVAWKAGPHTDGRDPSWWSTDPHGYLTKDSWSRITKGIPNQEVYKLIGRSEIGRHPCPPGALPGCLWATIYQSWFHPKVWVTWEGGGGKVKDLGPGDPPPAQTPSQPAPPPAPSAKTWVKIAELSATVSRTGPRFTLAGGDQRVTFSASGSGGGGVNFYIKKPSGGGSVWSSSSKTGPHISNAYLPAGDYVFELYIVGNYSADIFIQEYR